ncbi:hypothetical protein [Nostoc piscinale]|uniref:hypothetical protein n=1 Tax=Nostoc piscinale TaxID=224012 RepID=UPI000AFD8893|nr:hypothetical protein [Nostoc piscinale]
MKILSQAQAFGSPGIEPRWTHANKDAVGTAYSTSSRVWFTVWNGIVTEVYYPTVDRPQIRDLQYLISDGKSFFHEEKTPSAIKSRTPVDSWFRLPHHQCRSPRALYHYQRSHF